MDEAIATSAATTPALGAFDTVMAVHPALPAVAKHSNVAVIQALHFIVAGRRERKWASVAYFTPPPVASLAISFQEAVGTSWDESSLGLFGSRHHGGTGLDGMARRAHGGFDVGGMHGRRRK